MKQEELDLVTVICKELENHLGFSDKILAQFLIDLAANAQSIDDFHKEIKEFGAELPETLLNKILDKLNKLEPTRFKKLAPLEEKMNEEEDYEEIECIVQDMGEISLLKLIKEPQGSLYNAYKQSLVSKDRTEDQTVVLSPTEGDIGKYVNKNVRESLPIFNLKHDLMGAIQENQVLVVAGEAGVGIRSQIPQYLAEAGFAKDAIIGITMPSRSATKEVCMRVSQEFGCDVGEEVGYSLRFEEKTSSQTKIKYMTDGILLREYLIDPELSRYSVIIINDAQERTSNTDLLLYFLKNKTLKSRRDLKVIITSSLLSFSERLSNYFFSCSIFCVPGRLFPVDIFYTSEPETNYLEAAVRTSLQIHLYEAPGDILVFLPGQKEVNQAVYKLRESIKKIGSELLVLPCHSSLSTEELSLVFAPSPNGKRKCIFSTNIAEKSFAIEGIVYVVDSGFTKTKLFDQRSASDSLLGVPISQQSSMSRAGRAGRKERGKCFRLYTERAHQQEMFATETPEIQRTNLLNIILLLKALGIDDVAQLELLEYPPLESVEYAYKQLRLLGALDEMSHLAALGRQMAQFPLDPHLSKMLLSSVELGCSEEILTIVSMLCAEEIFGNSDEMKESSKNPKRSKLIHQKGDLFTLLNIFVEYTKNNLCENWCEENSVRASTVKGALIIRQQLVGLMTQLGLKLNSCGTELALIEKAIISGFFHHVAKRDTEGLYKTMIGDLMVTIQRTSSLCHNQPKWIIYHRLQHSPSNNIHALQTVISVDPKTLVQMAPFVFKFTSLNSTHSSHHHN